MPTACCAWRGDVWQCTRVVGGTRFDWRGVDKLRLRNGRIVEERVYMDTAPLCAARTGAVLEPIVPLWASRAARHLRGPWDATFSPIV